MFGAVCGLGFTQCSVKGRLALLLQGWLLLFLALISSFLIDALILVLLPKNQAIPGRSHRALHMRSRDVLLRVPTLGECLLAIFDDVEESVHDCLVDSLHMLVVLGQQLGDYFVDVQLGGYGCMRNRY